MSNVTDLDGRRARSARSREAAADAILELLDEGRVDLPSAAEVAERAGLSERTVFRLFDDLESLYAAAVQRQRERHGAAFLFVPTDGDLDRRIDVLVAHRVRLHETIRRVRPFAERLRYTSEAVGSTLAALDEEQRRQLAAQFAPELERLDPAERGEALDALAVATGWSTWDALRHHHGRSRERATRAVRRLVRSLLT